MLDRRPSFTYKVGMLTRTLTKIPHTSWSQKVLMSRKYCISSLIRHNYIKEIGIEMSNPEPKTDPSPRALTGTGMKLAFMLPQKVSTYIKVMSLK